MFGSRLATHIPCLVLCRAFWGIRMCKIWLCSREINHSVPEKSLHLMKGAWQSRSWNKRVSRALRVLRERLTMCAQGVRSGSMEEETSDGCIQAASQPSNPHHHHAVVYRDFLFREKTGSIFSLDRSIHAISCNGQGRFSLSQSSSPSSPPSPPPPASLQHWPLRRYLQISQNGALARDSSIPAVAPDRSSREKKCWLVPTAGTSAWKYCGITSLFKIT